MKAYAIAGYDLRLKAEPSPRSLALFAKMFGIRSFALLGENPLQSGIMTMNVLDLQIDRDKLNGFLHLVSDFTGNMELDEVESPEVLAEMFLDFFTACVERSTKPLQRYRTGSETLN